MSTQSECLQRRLKVSSLKIRGYSAAEIAQALNTTIDTVNNDTRVILSGKNKALLKHTRKEALAQLHLNANERAKYLWRIVEDAEKDQVKVNALRELRLNDEKILRMLSELDRDSIEEDEDDLSKEEMVKQVQELTERTRIFIRRNNYMEVKLRELFAQNDSEGIMKFLKNEFEISPDFTPRPEPGS